jgi:hypothetical protein
MARLGATFTHLLYVTHVLNHQFVPGTEEAGAGETWSKPRTRGLRGHKGTQNPENHAITAEEASSITHGSCYCNNLTYLIQNGAPHSLDHRRLKKK